MMLSFSFSDHIDQVLFPNRKLVDENIRIKQTNFRLCFQIVPNRNFLNKSSGNNIFYKYVGKVNVINDIISHSIDVDANFALR